MLGVPKNRVLLLPYNEKWVDEYSKVKELFMEMFPNEIVSIEHVGSTSIPEIMAKPMLDVAIVFKDITEQVFQKMKENNYLYYGEVASGKYLFILRGENEISLQHIHCYKSKDLTLFYEQIQFRDFLRTHSKQAKEYEELKLSLSKMYFDDRKKYTVGKQTFFDKIKVLVAQNQDTVDT